MATASQLMSDHPVPQRSLLRASDAVRGCGAGRLDPRRVDRDTCELHPSGCFEIGAVHILLSSEGRR